MEHQAFSHDIEWIVQVAQDNDAKIISELIADNIETVMLPFHSSNILNHIKEYNSEENIKKQLLWKDVFVYRKNNEILGTIALANFWNPDTAQKYAVSNLFVAPTEQGKGVGTMLLQYIIQLAISKHIQTLHVPSSRNAIEFYKNSGFQIDQQQPDEKDEITWMNKKLGS